MAKLIINADDFGYSKEFNRMILELIKQKQITATSVMIEHLNEEQKEQVRELISISKENKISVGLHIEFKDTNFQEQIAKQFNKFIEIFGFEPNHIDIHKIEFLKNGYPVIQKFCKERKIPCKNLSLFDASIMIDGVITTKESLFDGTGKSFEKIKEWIESLKDDIYVINFHPGYYDPESKSSLNKDREVDAENIRKINRILAEKGIELVNFSDLVESFS